MKSPRYRCALGALLLNLLSLNCIAQADDTTFLDQFVADKSGFSWSLDETVAGNGYTIYRLNVQSGDWLTTDEVNRTSWENFVNVYVPDTVSTETAVLYINGGTNHGSADSSSDVYGAVISVATESVMVEVQAVPNQPLQFSDETISRTEDDLIAYSWRKYLETGDEQWPAQLPMTRSAVRSMDAVQEFLTSPTIVDPSKQVTEFTVTGASKRGWTTWLTAAVDDRVTTAIPIVIDTLNVEASVNAHEDFYGFFSSAISPYVDQGIMDWRGTPEMQALFDLVDPYAYLDRLDMPKIVLNASGDEFFIPESWKMYYEDLPDNKYLRYIPNIGHGTGGDLTGLAFEAVSILEAVQGDIPLPEYDWELLPDGTFRVESDHPVRAVRLWQANNPEERDFRFSEVGGVFNDSFLEAVEPGVWMAEAPLVEEGYTAYFVEVEFDSPTSFPLKWSTGINVVSVPEPSTLCLATFALLSMGSLGWIRRRSQPSRA